jgi:plastocyanin
MIVRGRLALGPVAALLLLLPPPAAAAPRTHVVVIDKMKFGALPSGLKAGDTIIWENHDMFRHTATAKDGSFNVDLPAGAKGKMVLRKPGTFAFTCKFHPGMRGVLKVGK